MDRTSRRNECTGFTLIELTVVLAILAVTLSAGSDLMQYAIHGVRLDTEVSRLIGTLQFARSEAILRNHPVSVCPSLMAATGEAVCDGTYADGWIVFANPDRDKIVDEDSDVLLRVYQALPTGFRLTNRSGTRDAFEQLNFLPDGSSHSNRTLLLCPPGAQGKKSIGIVMNVVGRARLVRGEYSCLG